MARAGLQGLDIPPEQRGRACAVADGIVDLPQAIACARLQGKVTACGRQGESLPTHVDSCGVIRPRPQHEGQLGQHLAPSALVMERDGQGLCLSEQGEHLLVFPQVEQ